LPEIARAYLTLQSQFTIGCLFRMMLGVGQTQVVIIAAALAKTHGRNETKHVVTADFALVVTKLWAVLEPWHCRQNLLGI